MESYSIRVWVAEPNDVMEDRPVLRFKSWESAVAFVNRFNADEMNKPKWAYVEAE